jgi:hypothetical protein
MLGRLQSHRCCVDCLHACTTGDRSPDRTTFAVFRMPSGVSPGDTVVFEVNDQSPPKAVHLPRLASFARMLTQTCCRLESPLQFLPGRGVLVPPGVLPPQILDVQVGGTVDQISLPYGLGPGMRFHYLVRVEGIDAMPPDHPRALPSHTDARRSQVVTNQDAQGGNAGGRGAGETGLFVIGSLMLL